VRRCVHWRVNRRVSGDEGWGRGGERGEGAGADSEGSGLGGEMVALLGNRRVDMAQGCRELLSGRLAGRERRARGEGGEGGTDIGWRERVGGS